tara:strand:+ start:112 stop:369 length:258 start_codon:yes stop_codon:yes gene_type:complete
MRPKLRKVNTSKRKQKRKAAKEQLQRRAAAFLDHPKECCVCQSPFARTQQTVNTWHVTVQEKRVRLTCPDCWGTIKEIVENNTND